MLDVEAYRRIFLRFQKNTFHFFFVIFLFDPSTINNNVHEMSPEEFDFQLSPTPVTFRWTLIKEPVFLVD